MRRGTYCGSAFIGSGLIRTHFRIHASSMCISCVHANRRHAHERTWHKTYEGVYVQVKKKKKNTAMDEHTRSFTYTRTHTESQGASSHKHSLNHADVAGQWLHYSGV